MSDEFDPLVEEQVDDEFLPKKKRGAASDDDLGDLDEDFAIDDLDEDPFMADLGYGFGAEDEELY